MSVFLLVMTVLWNFLFYFLFIYIYMYKKEGEGKSVKKKYKKFLHLQQAILLLGSLISHSPL